MCFTTPFLPNSKGSWSLARVERRGCAPGQLGLLRTRAGKFDNPPPKRKKQQYWKDNSSKQQGPEAEVRLAKILAGSGVASRRACEELIAAGKVVVNGKVVTTQGVKVDPKVDKIEVEGQQLRLSSRPQLYYFAVNKPTGYICSNAPDAEGRRVVDLLQPWLDKWRETMKDLGKQEEAQLPPRLYNVGRLDVASHGLIFLTNDGQWANRVIHPSSNLTKEYVVVVDRRPSRRDLQKILTGVSIDGVLVAPEEVTLWSGGNGGPHKLRVVISEGKKHEWPPAWVPVPRWSSGSWVLPGVGDKDLWLWDVVPWNMATWNYLQQCEQKRRARRTYKDGRPRRVKKVRRGIHRPHRHPPAFPLAQPISMLAHNAAMHRALEPSPHGAVKHGSVAERHLSGGRGSGGAPWQAPRGTLISSEATASHAITAHSWSHFDPPGLPDHDLEVALLACGGEEPPFLGDIDYLDDALEGSGSLDEEVSGQKNPSRAGSPGAKRKREYERLLGVRGPRGVSWTLPSVRHLLANSKPLQTKAPMTVPEDNLLLFSAAPGLLGLFPSSVGLVARQPLSLGEDGVGGQVEEDQRSVSFLVGPEADFDSSGQLGPPQLGRQVEPQVDRQVQAAEGKGEAPAGRHDGSTFKYHSLEGVDWQVRLMVAAAGLQVVALKRTRVGGFRMTKSLKRGDYIQLTSEEAALVLDYQAELRERSRPFE